MSQGLPRNDHDIAPATESAQAVRAAQQQEWIVLHANHEQAERTAGWIKAGAILLTFATLAIAVDVLLASMLILVLWLQEGIVRTSQARAGARLLHVEALIRSPQARSDSAFQLHTSWQQTRAGTTALVKEYLRHSLRPTVAYPYVVLLGILLTALLLP